METDMRRETTNQYFYTKISLWKCCFPSNVLFPICASDIQYTSQTSTTKHTHGCTEQSVCVLEFHAQSLVMSVSDILRADLKPIHDLWVNMWSPKEQGHVVCYVSEAFWMVGL